MMQNLWCMGLRKNIIGSRPSPKKNILISCYSTTMEQWEHMIEKNSDRTRPSPNKNYFAFWLQYYYDEWDL